VSSDAGTARCRPQHLLFRHTGAKQEVRNLTVMQMRPNQTPEKLALLRSLERSTRAEARLRQAALDHHERLRER
jgi:hypothetical protein